MRALAAALIVLAVAGCHSTSVEVVRSLASDDFPCPQQKIQVTPGRDKGTWRADGCGKSGNYTCEGWDSYNQKPVCTPTR
jgi:hypothetical protein